MVFLWFHWIPWGPLGSGGLSAWPSQVTNAAPGSKTSEVRGFFAVGHVAWAYLLFTIWSLYIYIYIYVYNIYIYIVYIYMYIYLCTYIYIYIYMYTYTYTYIRTHAYYIYIYIVTCSNIIGIFNYMIQNYIYIYVYHSHLPTTITWRGGRRSLETGADGPALAKVTTLQGWW